MSSLPPRLVPQRAFPPYAYVPGVHPHPTKSPEGHSYLPKGEKVLATVYPQDWSDCEDHLYAVDLINHGYYWEAHEAWEELWHLAPLRSPERQLLQGLIQYAAGCLKRSMNQDRAADTLFGRSRQRLKEIAASPADVGIGLAIGALLHTGLPLQLAHDPRK